MPLLTLREIWVRIQQLPDNAELVMLVHDGRVRWSDSDYLLSDLCHLWAGKPHPARPKPRAKASDSRRDALRKRRIREKREREAAYAAQSREEAIP